MSPTTPSRPLSPGSPHRQSRHAPITGHAVVRHKNAETYVGRVNYDGRAITGSMSLRVIANGVVEYRPPKQRTFPLHRLEEILWDDDAVTIAEHAVPPALDRP